MSASHSHLGKFLVTPKILKDESLRGYVARVAQRNGSLGLVQQHLESLSSASHAIPVFSDLTGILGDLLATHGSTRIDNTSKEISALFGNVMLPINQVWKRSRYFCPLCIGTNGISKSYWDLKIYSTCHKHRVPLVSKCSDCKRKFCWDSGLPDFCTCGLHISAVKTEIELPHTSCRFFELVAASFEQTIDCTRPTQIPNSVQKFPTLIWTLLLIEFIKFVLIPAFLADAQAPEVKIDDLQIQELIATMLWDKNYRKILHEAVFLHAAKDPMTMSRALTPGNRSELIQNYYKDCIEEIPFHACLWNFQESMKLKRAGQEMKSTKPNFRSPSQRQLMREFFLEQRHKNFGVSQPRKSYRETAMTN